MRSNVVLNNVSNMDMCMQRSTCMSAFYDDHGLR